MKLEEIEKLCDQATPGPWTEQTSRKYMDFGCYESIPGVIGWSTHVGYCRDKEVKQVDADSKFIAASRELMPKLLAVAKAARLVGYYTDHMRDDEDNSHGLTELDRALEELEKL